MERSLSSLQDRAVPMPMRRPSLSSNMKDENGPDSDAEDSLNPSIRSFFGKFFSSSKSSDVFKALLPTDGESDDDSLSSFESFSSGTCKSPANADATRNSTFTKPKLVRELGTFNLPPRETPERPTKSPEKLLQLPTAFRIPDRTDSNLSSASTHSSVSILKTSSNHTCLQFDIPTTSSLLDRALPIVAKPQPTTNVQPRKWVPVSRTRSLPVRTHSTMSLDESQHVVLVTSPRGCRHLELNFVGR